MITIQARENDDQILLRSLGPQDFKYIEDENQNHVSIDSAFYSQTNTQAVPMYYFRVPKGTWSVDVTCEGYQSTCSTTDPHRGKSDGMIAYADNNDLWNVGESDGVKITKLSNDNTYRRGHPDLEVNSCHFRDGQLIERDASISFHLEASRDGRFFLIGPAIQKTAKYNYTVSRGEWTDRDMELGLVTVVLDEHLDGVGPGRKLRPLRAGREVVQHIETPERQPEEQTRSASYSLDLERTPASEGKPIEQTRSTTHGGDETAAPPSPGEERTDESAPLSSSEVIPDHDIDAVNEKLSRLSLSIREPTQSSTPIPQDSPRGSGALLRGGAAVAQDRRSAEDLTETRRSRFGKALLPSLGGSRASALQGGTLRRAKSESLRKHMTTEELQVAARIEQQQGKAAKERYIESLDLASRGE
jgi:hypothetical protein